MPNDLTHVFVPFADVIKTTVKAADGSDVPARIVRGIMTEEKLDLDQQIVDYDWAKGASAKWWNFANIREQHTSKGVGKGREIEYDDAARRITLTSKIVDSEAVMKIDEGVYSGYSIGIKNAGIVKDAKAPNGRINRGNQVECSIVDHPSLETAKFAVVKMRKDGAAELAKGVELLSEDDDELLTKVAAGEETKLADVETGKGSIIDDAVADLEDGLNDDDTNPPGKQTVGNPKSTGEQLEVTPDSAIGRRKKKTPPEGDGSAQAGLGSRDKPKGADAETEKASKARAAADDAEDAADGADDEAAEGEDPKKKPKAKAFDLGDLVAKLIESGDRGAAIAVLRASETIDKGSSIQPANIDGLNQPGTMPAAAQNETSASTAGDELDTTPGSALPRKKKVTPADGGEGAAVTAASKAAEPDKTSTDDASKAVLADTMKAAISEAVSKAVESALAPLREKVDEMAKRAAPGGPQLGPSKLLSATTPPEVKTSVIKARLSDIRDAAENHPDFQIRAGAKQILAEMAKEAEA